MLMTVPAMIWSTLWRIPSQASRRPRRPAAIIAAETPAIVAMNWSRSRSEDHAADDDRDARSDEHLAFEGDVEHAAPLGQDPGEGAERQRGRQLEALAEHAGEVRGLAVQQGAEDGEHGRHEQDEQPDTPAERGAAPQLQRADERGRDAGDDPQDADRRRDLEAIRARCCRPGTGTTPATPNVLDAKPNDRRRAPRKASPRIRALRSARRAARPSPCGDTVGGRGLDPGDALVAGWHVAVMPAPPAQQAPTEATSGGGFATFTRQIVRISPGRGDEHDDHRDDEEQQVERDAGLDAHLPAAGRQRPEQEGRGDDAAAAGGPPAGRARWR